MLLVQPLALIICVPALILALSGAAAAQALPAPAAQPAERGLLWFLQSAAPAEPSPLSACRLRLTGELASAPSVPAIEGPGGCGADDVVQLEAVVLPDRRRIAVTPPAILRCELAEAIVQWVREDVAPAARLLKSALKSIDNYASYDCRGRNRVAGANLSEHGKASALDIRSVKLANGDLIGLTDPRVSREFRTRLRARTCGRFMTVLGPGSDGYHEDHVHVDLAARASGLRMCHWEVRDPVEGGEISDAPVPLPRPRPGRRQG
jgi:hypothetical protein